MIRRLDPPNDDDEHASGPPNGEDIPFGPLGDDHQPYDPLDKDTDCFKPPDEATEVGCLHCGGIFMSSQMTWRIETGSDDKPFGFWCCPDPACDGKGFGFDLLPTDPDYRDENGGWVYCDDEEIEDDAGPWPDPTGESFDPPKDWSGDDSDTDLPF